MEFFRFCNIYPVTDMLIKSEHVRERKNNTLVTCSCEVIKLAIKVHFKLFYSTVLIFLAVYEL